MGFNETKYQGNARVKRAQLQRLRRTFETLEMKVGEGVSFETLEMKAGEVSEYFSEESRRCF